MPDFLPRIKTQHKFRSTGGSTGEEIDFSAAAPRWR
jgi:hypothetical protein